MTVQLLPDIKFDVNPLIEEYKSMAESNLVHISSSTIPVVHSMFTIDFNSGILDLMPHTNKVVEYLKSKFPIVSVTYRVLPPNIVYKWHTDSGTPYYHIPLITNSGCWFVYEHKCFHMPADGSLYKVSTSRPHTFMNGGSEYRVHLIGET
jgi:hypothetical protein